jgi:hypothetical protein
MAVAGITWPDRLSGRGGSRGMRLIAKRVAKKNGLSRDRSSTRLNGFRRNPGLTAQRAPTDASLAIWRDKPQVLQ